MDIPDSHADCPVGHATALLGDRWSLLIVREALAGVDRYGGFSEALGISDHTLTRRLTHLQEIGVLQRNDTHARYHLTEAGIDLSRVLAVLGDWSVRWLPLEPPIRQPVPAVIEAAHQLGLEPPSALLAT
jgi:DNA-binding HxlR family transcriptional regulator